MLELFKKQNTQYGDALKKALEDRGFFKDSFGIGTKGSQKSQYNQIFFMSFPMGNFSKKGFQQNLKRILKK